MKYAEDGNLEAACQKALQQIEDKKYAAGLKEDGMRSIIKYGIACYKKECKVEKGGRVSVSFSEKRRKIMRILIAEDRGGNCPGIEDFA